MEAAESGAALELKGRWSARRGAVLGRGPRSGVSSTRSILPPEILSPGGATAAEGSTNRPIRLTVRQTADQLGISEDAVRSRIKRGTLHAVRESGEVVVLLDADRRTTDQPTSESTNQADHSSGAHSDYRDELIEELRDRVRYLEESNRENRRIIAGLVQRVPELETADVYSSGYYDGDESGQERPQRHESEEEEVTPSEVAAEPHSTSQEQSEPKRSWWRRLLGG